MRIQRIKNIIVAFKTHLDIGFTDFASEVVRRYNEVYILSGPPAAASTMF